MLVVKRWAPILVVLLLGFGVRLALLGVFPHVPVEFDQSAYQKQALALLAEGLVKWDYDLRAPGYIFFLALSFLTGGGSADPLFVRLAQSLLATVTIACIYGITQLAFRFLSCARTELVALLAAGMMALYPDLVFFSQTLWSESFFLFVTALGLYLLLWSWRGRKFPVGYIVTGLVMGYAVLTREALLLFCCGMVPLWLWLFSSDKRRTGLKYALVYGGAVLLVLVPWGARNFAHGRGLELISSQGGRDLIIYNLVALEPGITDRGVRVMRRENARSSEYDAALRASIVERIVANPSEWLSAKSVEVREIWEDAQSNLSQFGLQLKLISPADIARVEPWLELLWWLILGLALVGFLLPQPASPRVLFLGYFLSWVLIIFLVHYIPRFRLGLIPFLLPFTAFAIVQLAGAAYALLAAKKPLLASSAQKESSP